MNPEEYASLFELAEKHWWFLGTRDILFSSISRESLRGEPVLDVGCGSGTMMRRFGNAGTVVGIDLNLGALAHCRSLGFSKLCQASADLMPFKPGSFAVVVAADLLEHCEDDESVLRELFRVTATGGMFLASVPAYQTLWSAHDVVLHHKRRYSKSELVRKAQHAGFLVTRVSSFNSFLFAPVAVARLAKAKFQKGQTSRRIQYHENWRLLNRMLLGVMRLEQMIIRRVNLPFGLSILLLASKR